MKVATADLGRILDRIQEYLRATDQEAIDLPNDLYWVVPGDKCFDMTQEPRKLGVGQLTDDWVTLQRLLSDDYDPVSYDFISLSAILRAIGETATA